MATSSIELVCGCCVRITDMGTTQIKHCKTSIKLYAHTGKGYKDLTTEEKAEIASHCLAWKEYVRRQKN